MVPGETVKSRACALLSLDLRQAEWKPRAKRKTIRPVVYLFNSEEFISILLLLEVKYLGKGDMP